MAKKKMATTTTAAATTKTTVVVVVAVLRVITTVVYLVLTTCGSFVSATAVADSSSFYQQQQQEQPVELAKAARPAKEEETHWIDQVISKQERLWKSRASDPDNDDDDDDDDDNQENEYQHQRWEIYNETEEPAFLIPKHLNDFESVPLVHRQTGQVVCPFARMIKVPSTLTEAITQYAIDTGLMDLFWNHTYGTTSPKYKKMTQNRPDHVHNKNGDHDDDGVQLDTVKDGRQWITITPGLDSNWPRSDIHWMDTANEEGYEEILRMLRTSGKDFDVVLDRMGREFALSSLTVTALGFMAITYSHYSHPHRDNYGAQENFFQMLLPIVLPEKDVATLLVGGTMEFHQDRRGRGGGYRDDWVGPVQFRKDLGIIISGDTLHATPTFDFRPHKGLRVVASIYFANLDTPQVRRIVAGDGTAIFPPRGLTAWFTAQQGRHYGHKRSNSYNQHSKTNSDHDDGDGASLRNDPGRYLLGDNVIKNEWSDAVCLRAKEQGHCETDISGTRMHCLKTCNVFIDDETYFQKFYPHATPQIAPVGYYDDKEDDNDITKLPQSRLEVIHGNIELLIEYEYWWHQVSGELARRRLVAAAAAAAAATAKEQDNDNDANSLALLPESEEPNFLIPAHMKDFEFVPLVRRATGQQVDEYARVMKLPPSLTREITKYANDTALMDLFWSHTYGDTSPVRHGTGICEPDPFWCDTATAAAAYQNMSRWSSEQEEELASNDNPVQLDQLRDGREWITSTPGFGNNWPTCDIHWMDTANEAGYEEILHVLRRGGFGRVLDALGVEFEAESWTVTAVRFMAVTHSSKSNLHNDNPNAGKRFFQMLIPIVLPEKDVATLGLGGDVKPPFGMSSSSTGNDDVVVEQEVSWEPIRFRYDTGIIISGDTLHNTPDFDFQANRGLRVVASIYIADLVQENTIEIVAGDGTAIFPPRGMMEWFAAQESRHWGKGFTFENDPGRLPLGGFIADELDEEQCAWLKQQGKCEQDVRGARMSCLKTCGVLIDDDVYFTKYFPEEVEEETTTTTTTTTRDNATTSSQLETTTAGAPHKGDTAGTQPIRLATIAMSWV